MTACTRTTLVEACFDGRLGPGEEASMARHVGSCSSCRDALRELEAVRDALRARAPRIAPLAHRRARLALLRASATPPPTRRRAWSVALVVAALPALGWAAVAVAPPPSRPEAPFVDTSPAVVREPVVAPARPVALERAPVVVGPERSPRASASPTAPSRDDASRRFAEAVAEVASGDFGAAARDLDAFAAAHPTDPRAEEAVYLQAIALERAGRRDDASRVARRYLASYPNGAHRSPAARLAGD